MDRDDVIRMAVEARYNKAMSKSVMAFDDFDLERFANLVAAHEREECAKIATQEGSLWAEYSDGRVSLNGVAAAIRARR